MWVAPGKGPLQDRVTQLWVRATGRRFDGEGDRAAWSWLLGPTGDVRVIDDAYIAGLAAGEHLRVEHDAPGAGLLHSVDEFALSPEERGRVDPSILDFYTHTSRYDVGLAVRWNPAFRPFGWLVRRLFSERLRQLNLPLGREVGGGVESHLIRLRDPGEERPRYTVWYRKLRATGEVLFSGVYGTTTIPDRSRCVKVVFPLPNGSATVVLRRQVEADGALTLVSQGRGYGEPGFYFVLTAPARGEGAARPFWLRYVRAMHERLTVHPAREGALAAEHAFSLWGSTFLSLRYVLRRKGGA